MLDNKDVDAVIIGTPDHWHALIMIHAVEAGKDVYVEKPVGNSIEECRLMVAAQVKYNKVVQAGQWQRSQQHFSDAVDFIRTGKLGNIRTVKVWCYQGWMKPGPVVPDTAPPAGVDYDMWLGPAKKTAIQCKPFSFQFPLVLGLCRWIDDRLGCASDGLCHFRNECTCAKNCISTWAVLLLILNYTRKHRIPWAHLYEFPKVQPDLGSCDGYR